MIDYYKQKAQKKALSKSAAELKSGNPVGIRTQTNWTKTSCATITQRGYSDYSVIYSNVGNLQIRKKLFFK